MERPLAVLNPQSNFGALAIRFDPESSTAIVGLRKPPIVESRVSLILLDVRALDSESGTKLMRRLISPTPTAHTSQHASRSAGALVNTLAHDYDYNQTTGTHLSGISAPKWHSNVLRRQRGCVQYNLMASIASSAWSDLSAV